MTGLYIAVDLAALGEVASYFSSSVSGGGARHELASFDHPGADAAASDFSRAAQAHTKGLADASRRAATVLHGYSVAFHQVGDR